MSGVNSRARIRPCYSRATPFHHIMKHSLPRLASFAALLCTVTSLHASTTVIDFSGTQYADNFTETFNATMLTPNNGGVEMKNGSSAAGIATYNSSFPSAVTDDFSLKIDGKFSFISTSTFDGHSVGFFSNISGTTGYLAVFRIRTQSGVSYADLRIFEGASTTSTAVGAQVGGSGGTATLSGASLGTTFASNTFYTFNLDVAVDTDADTISFTGSILSTDNGSVIGSFLSIVDTSPTLGGTGVGLRIGTQGGDGRITTVDNFVLSTIPEPSTYALLGGAGALGLALMQRRKRS